MSLNFDFGVPVSVWQQPPGTKQCLGCNRYIKIDENGKLVPHGYKGVRVGPGPGKYGFQPSKREQFTECDLGE